MINVERYISELIDLLKVKFDSRLLYVGLQGSYLRGEATDDSDIDIMVVIDELSVSDMKDYRIIIQSLDHSDRSCGFICSKADLQNWNPLEISHLFHSTKSYYGNMIDWIPAYTAQDIRNYIKLSLNNLYHEICHRFIHADANENREHLPVTYRSVFFILQNLYYFKYGKFVGSKASLLALLDGKDHAVLERSLSLSDCRSWDFDESFELLFTWCQDTLKTL